MKSQQSLPEELKQIQRRFNQWRRTRSPGSRIPSTLWEEATLLARRHGVSRVANLLGLDYPKLRERALVGDNASDPTPASQVPGFVEVDLQQWVGAAPCTIRIEKPGGSSMTVALPGRSTGELIQVAQGLWGQCS